MSGLSFLLEEYGMERATAIQFYNSKAWLRCKESYLTLQNHLCERCLAKGLYEPAKIVHHKVYLTDENFGDDSLMFGFDNLECLCASCHNEEHKSKKNEKRWKFVDGVLVTRETDG